MFGVCRGRLEINSAWCSDSAARFRSRSDGVDALGLYGTVLYFVEEWKHGGQGLLVG